MIKPEFMMMVGLPYSGKSSFVEEWASDNPYIVHSSDAVRAELFGDVQDQDHNVEVFDTLHRRIRDDLLAGQNVLFDATNLSYKRRIDELKRIAKIDCRKTCVFMATPFCDILERSEHRDRVVPYAVLEQMYKSVWIPNAYEGWDEIDLVYPPGFRTYDIYEMLEGLERVPHDNPHHRLTIGEHCITAYRAVQSVKNCTPELEYAALLHDIGKPFTKAFVNSSGDPSDVAHYYGHHHVSAYASLFYLPDSVDRLHVAAVIQHHMRPFEIERLPVDQRPGLFRKFRDLVGDRVYNDVMSLHTADLCAH